LEDEEVEENNFFMERMAERMIRDLGIKGVKKLKGFRDWRKWFHNDNILGISSSLFCLSDFFLYQ
jgi:hypothetical protein